MCFNCAKVISVIKMINTIVILSGINSDEPAPGVSSLAWASSPEGVHFPNRSKDEMKCIPNAVPRVRNPAGIGLFNKTPHIIRQESKNNT